MTDNYKKLCSSILVFFSAFSIITTASEAYGGDTKYCDPFLRKCEAPFSIGKDKITPQESGDNNYCDPFQRKCEAPFTLGKDKISSQEGGGYCNPGYHKCEAPFTTGLKNINQ